MAIDQPVLFLSGAELWQRGHGPNHPLKPDRLKRTHELLEEYGAFRWPNLTIQSPAAASAEELKLFHTDEYVEAVKTLSQGLREVNPSRYNFGPGDNPVFAGMYHSEGLKVGSALQGARAIKNGSAAIAFSYGGGLHHAAEARASGFCVFNDGAVAIHWLKEHYDRIFYLDVDVHHGDGVQDAFYSDPSVFTCSLHQDPATLFPGTGFVNEIGEGEGRGYCANVPLPPGTHGALYLKAFNELALPLIARFQPDILVTQLGVDTHYKDPLAQLNLTTQDQQTIFRTLKQLELPWLALGGGGYDLSVVPRSWSLALAEMAGRVLPGDLPTEYRKRYGGEKLHDPEDAVLAEWKGSEDLQDRVELIIDQCRQQFAL